MTRTLTEVQAFGAMVEFLSTYASQTHSEEIDELSTSLSYWVSEGEAITLTPGYWGDWRAAVTKAISKQGSSPASP